MQLSMCVGHASRDLDMVVHGDGFIVAGCGDDLDRLSQKLIGKLELVQKARLGPGYDSEATVLNRCVLYNDSGLTWEADPRHAELAVAELGFQAARPQTSPGAKAKCTTGPRGTGTWWAKSLPQHVSGTGISGIGPT